MADRVDQLRGVAGTQRHEQQQPLLLNASNNNIAKSGGHVTNIPQIQIEDDSSGQTTNKVDDAVDMTFQEYDFYHVGFQDSKCFFLYWFLGRHSVYVMLSSNVVGLFTLVGFDPASNSFLVWFN